MSTENAPTSEDGRAQVQGSQSVDRAVRLLELLGPGPHEAGLTVTELAQALGVGRPVVYRLVRSLENASFIRRTADGRYCLGFGLYRLSAAVADAMAVIAIPLLRTLADEVGATAHLTVARGGEAVAVAVVEPSWTTMHLTYRVGSRHPLDRGAAGRAILAGRAGRLEPVTSENELQSGAHGLAAPVLGVANTEASVGVVSLGALDDAVAGPRVLATSALVAEALNRELGTTPGRRG